jgi:hypothetical protein
MLTLTEANTILRRLGLPVIRKLGRPDIRSAAADDRPGLWVLDRAPAPHVYKTVARAFRVAIRGSFINATEPLTSEERRIVNIYRS